MESLWQDLKLGARALARSLRFALIVIVTMGIGIAANTIIFSVANSLFLRGLPYPDANCLIFLSRGYPGSPQGGGKFSYPEFRDIQQQNNSFDAMAAHQAFGALALTEWAIRSAWPSATPHLHFQFFRNRFTAQSADRRTCAPATSRNRQPSACRE